MNTEKINRSYLETLSFSDLSNLADEHGIEIPENFDRRLLIGEILEFTQEFETNKNEVMMAPSDNSNENLDELPKNYNETQITCILRNPVWAFIFWNISENDSLKIREIEDCSLMIRVCVLSSPENLTPEESFEVNASLDTQEQYVLLPAGKKYFRFELVYVSSNNGKVLAFSPVVKIPQGGESLNEFQPGKDNNYSKIIQLSGVNKILMDQYTNHRHSFS